MTLKVIWPWKLELATILKNNLVKVIYIKMQVLVVTLFNSNLPKMSLGAYKPYITIISIITVILSIYKQHPSRPLWNIGGL